MPETLDNEELKKQIEASIQDFHELWDADYDDIWKIEDKSDFLIAMNGWLCKKGNYGEDIGKLSHAERVFYYISQLESEVNNGGFSQFFDNSSGSFANEIVDSLHEIGADRTAEIYNKAFAALGCALPTDWEERRKKLDDIMTNDQVGELLEECDNEFFQYPDNLEELNYQFIVKNKAQFTRE